MKIPDPRELLNEALKSGKLIIPTPYQGYVGRVALHYDVQASDFTEYFNAATVEDLPEHTKRYLTIAKEGVSDFNDSIDNMLGTPELDFHIPRSENGGWTTPRLDGFDVDNRINVKLLSRMGIKYDYNGEVIFGGDVCSPFSLSLRYDIKPRLHRAYTTEKRTDSGSDMGIFRFPVILNTNNGEGPKLHNFLDLSYYVLLNQLEPSTTDHLCQRLYNLGDLGKKVSNEQFDGELDKVLEEERIVAKILIGGWSESVGIKTEPIMEWVSSMIDNDDIKIGLSQVRKKGTKRLINFYCGSKWKLEKLLQPV